MAKLDLSLIRVLCAVYETRSVSRAAAALSVTQPAVSYALGRLRETTGNPLFVRSGTGMIPTMLADHLFRDFRRGLDLIEGTLTSIVEFDPAVSERRFRIAMADIGEMVFLPPLLEHLKTCAPRVTLESCQVSPVDTPVALATGQLDLAVGYLPSLKVRGAELFKERYVCLFRNDHPLIGETLNADVFASCSHVTVASNLNNHGGVWDSLTTLGVDRLGLRLSHFASLPAVLSTTDLVAAVPSRVARMFALTHDLRALPIPLDLQPIAIKVYWDPQYDVDRSHAWIRDVVISVVSQL